MPTTNIRPELSTYVGREDELATVAGLLADRRLVTLLGLGGVGKTRMAIEIALRSSDLWPAGAWMVELGDVDGERAVDVALRSVFAGQVDLAAETGADGSVADGVAAQLGTARALLIFDNCEHLIADVGRTVNTLLRECPGIRVLTTSREVLSVPGETVRQITPLEWAEAIELFSSRGADAKASFAVDAGNEAAVRTICERLDRLPLGIELAAARLRAFTPDQLASRLSERLGSIGGRSPLRATRQQTMHDAVDWSYALLFTDERLLLRRLSVFPASFGLEAIEAVAADEDLFVEDVSDVLARLIDKSLVVVEASDGEQRYRLLHTVADFAGERLAEAGETKAIRDRHTDWVGDLARRARAGLRGAGYSMWTAQIRAEMPDIFRALQWARGGGDPVRGLQIAVDMGWYAFTSTTMTDLAGDVIDLLGHTPDVPTDLRARAMAWAGVLNAGTAPGLHLGREAVALARESGDVDAVAEAAIMLAMSLVLSPRTAPEGVRFAREGLDAALRAGDPWLGALAESQEGMAALTSGTEGRNAAMALAEAAQAFRNLGDERTAILVDLRWTEAAEMNGDIVGAIDVLHRARAHVDLERWIGSVAIASRLAWLSVRQGHAAQAQAYAAEVFDATNPSLHAPPCAMAHFAFGAASMMIGGDRGDARRHLTAALKIHEAVSSTRHLVLDHSILGYLDAQQGDHENSRLHHERALALGHEAGLALPLAYVYEKCALSMVLRGDALGAADMLARGEALHHSAGLERTEVEERTFWRVRNRAIELAGADEVAAIEERLGVLL